MTDVFPSMIELASERDLGEKNCTEVERGLFLPSLPLLLTFSHSLVVLCVFKNERGLQGPVNVCLPFYCSLPISYFTVMCYRYFALSSPCVTGVLPFTCFICRWKITMST